MKKFLLLLFVLGSFLCSYPVSAQTITTIKIEKDGFYPQITEVEKGTIIKFVNDDTIDHWPASNPHPTHTDYPELDPKTPILPGQSWIFKADKPGEWRYHDHLNPHILGEIKIKGSIQNNQNLLLSLKGFISVVFQRISAAYQNITFSQISTDRFRQLDETAQIHYLTSLSQSKGADKAWTFLKSAYTDQAGASVGNPHDLAHLIGGLLYQQKGIAGFGSCSTEFAFGCYHGFAESAFANGLTHLQDLENSCESLGEAGSGPWASCVHGLGHGIATYYLDTALMGSLYACDKLSQGQTYCYDGVFMEFASGARKSVYSATDPLFPCDSIDQKYRQGCARNQPTVLSNFFNKSYQDIASICSNSQDPDISTNCIDQLGFWAAHQYPQSPVDIAHSCDQIPDSNLKVECYSAAAGELVFQNFTGWQQNSSALCTQLDSNNQDKCLERINAIALDYHR